MRKPRLTTAGVAYDPILHTYTSLYSGLRLQGITKVIRDKIFPDEYAGVSEQVLNQAATRGHRIHSALELWDTQGIPTTDCKELDNYIRLNADNKFLEHHRASEYVVTDEAIYASAIDKVFDDPTEDLGIVLADIKTTYKLNEEYVSWQLSVYAYFFEKANPKYHVTHLYAIWLREDKAKVVEVSRKTNDQVSELLYGVSEIKRTDYAKAEDLPTIAGAEDKLIKLKQAADEAAAAYDKLKAGLLDIMEKANVKKYESNKLIITRKAATTSKRFDSARFKADNPNLYASYLTETQTKGGIMITIR